MNPLKLAPRSSLLRRIEAMGVRSVERHWKLLPPDEARRLRPRVTRIGDAFLTLLETSDSLRMNRVKGLGHRGRAREAMVDEIVAWYRAAGVRRFSVLLGPGPQALRIAGWLQKRGFRRQGGLTLLLRDGRRPVPSVASPVRVVRAGPAQAPAVVGIHERCFGVPGSRRGWTLAAAAAPGPEHYLAWAATRPVGVGAVWVAGALAWLGGAATLTRWRRRGVHGALIAARLRRAARRGCRWAWAETLAPGPGRPDGSRRNLMRLGFEPVCLKPTFVWQER